jgi:hypothetical protein
MATQKQIDANRRNAKKSTGPRTSEGKLRSRMNSLKHGLAAVHVSLPHEDPSEYHQARAALVESWQPANTQELMLVDAIAAAWIRMQRASRYEASLVDGQLRTIKHRHGKSEAPRPEDDDFGVIVAMSDPENEQAWAILARYDTRAASAWHRAVEQLRKLQNDRKRQPVQEIRAQKERDSYLKRTVANPGWQPPMPVSAAESTPVASFGRPATPVVIPFVKIEDKNTSPQDTNNLIYKKNPSIDDRGRQFRN